MQIFTFLLRQLGRYDKKSHESKMPLYIVLISVHGLIRGNDLELGRDADTGG